MKLEKVVKNILLKRLVELKLIRKEDGKYYSTCVYGEEITIELKELFE